MFRNRMVQVGGGILVLLVLVALTAPLWVKAGLLGGVMFVENVFALPGIGTLAVQNGFNLDVAANLGEDVLYRWINPRIKLSA